MVCNKLIVFLAALALAVGTGASARADEAGSATAILDRAIKALGGEEKLGKIKAVSWKTRGTLALPDNETQITTQSTLQGLDHARQEFEGEFGGVTFKAVTVLAGSKGWRDFGGDRSELDRESLANEKRTLYLNLVPVTIMPLKSKEFKVTALAEETVGGKPQTGIKATGPDGKEFRLYFDKESALPVRLVARVLDFMGEEFTQETTLGDYKEMAGIQKATKIAVKRDGETFLALQVTDFKVLETVDPATFAELK